MPIDNLKNASFLPSSDTDWEEKAEESLKGKKLESLKKNTYENIILKPLYSKTDQIKSTDFPGGTNYRRGLHALGYHSNPWRIAQKVSYHTVKELTGNLAVALEKGQTALAFKLEKVLFDDPDQFEQLLAEFMKKAPFAIQTDGLQKEFLASLISVCENKDASGFVAEDPISILVEKGSLSIALDDYIQSWAETIETTGRYLPNLKTVLIDTTAYHSGGANAVQELAIALGTGVQYLEELKQRGLGAEKLFEKMIFKFQIGSNFFMELAKLRAARVLWDKIGEAYNLPAEKRGMEIIAETSAFNKTLQDPHVNILRSGNEAFAAILGGVQYLQVQAFNELEVVTSLSERLARNTQLILKEETFLQNIVDPAGGSWYIESLTSELVEKAWEYFLSIEEKGGLMEVLQSNWLQSEIATVFNKRQQDTFVRKQSIIGTNVYANLQETLKWKKYEKEDGSYIITKVSLKELIQDRKDNRVIQIKDVGQQYHSIQPIKSQRLAEPFEKLRQRAYQLTVNQVGLICVGELKEYKTRADFMNGFLATGGLDGVSSQGVKEITDAQAFIKESKLKHYVLCSSNDSYSEFGLELFKILNVDFPDVNFYLAGLPEKETQSLWQELGIKDFIHMKTNSYECISSIIHELEGVAQND